MLLILEIAMLLGGAYALFTGKVPQFLVGGKGEYKLEGGTARVIGLVLMTPLPLAFVALAVVAIMVGGVPDTLVSILVEAGIVIGVAIIIGLWIRSARTPVGAASASDMAGPGPGAPGAGR